MSKLKESQIVNGTPTAEVVNGVPSVALGGSVVLSKEPEKPVEKKGLFRRTKK